jgi:hypothetical protein
VSDSPLLLKIVEDDGVVGSMSKYGTFDCVIGGIAVGDCIGSSS